VVGGGAENAASRAGGLIAEQSAVGYRSGAWKPEIEKKEAKGRSNVDAAAAARGLIVGDVAEIDDGAAEQDGGVDAAAGSGGHIVVDRGPRHHHVVERDRHADVDA